MASTRSAGVSIARPLSTPLPGRLTAAFVRRVAPSHRRCTRVFYKEGESPEAPESQKTQQVLDELKKKGMTPAKAKDVLRVWTELGATNPEELRKLLVKRSTTPVSGLALQTLLDTLASFGGFYCGHLVGTADFPGKIFVEIGIYFVACYYTIQAVLEGYAVFLILYTANRYRTSGGEILAAVQQLAAASPGGFPLMDRVQLAANTGKVLQLLDSIVQLLKEQASHDGEKPTTLENLRAYLTLSRAKDTFGFDPATFGLTEGQASEIAAVFARYDTNENGRLELSELRSLCDGLGKELSDEELKEAVRILDSDNSGNIEFNEFVDWWVKGKGSASTAE